MGALLIYPLPVPFLALISNDSGSSRAGKNVRYADASSAHGEVFLSSMWRKQASSFETNQYRPAGKPLYCIRRLFFYRSRSDALVMYSFLQGSNPANKALRCVPVGTISDVEGSCGGALSVSNNKRHMSCAC